MSEKAPPLRPGHFRRVDETPDTAFYGPPRLVTHIDAAARQALTQIYRRRLPQGGDLLDLMSSCVSHLPDDVAYGHVAGLGMNLAELEANPRLDERAVHDLNADPVLPWPDARFDACLIAVSVQYLTRPVEVFAEIARVLRPGAGLMVAYSSRTFPTKAVALWKALDMKQRARLVARYMADADGFDAPRAEIAAKGGAGDPLVVVSARRRETAI